MLVHACDHGDWFDTSGPSILIASGGNADPFFFLEPWIPVIRSLAIPSEIDQRLVPNQLEKRIAADLGRIEAFQDHWDRPQIEQFVAADFRHLYQALSWIRETQMLLGNRFLEWGCGFAVVASIASQLGFDAIGIEAERELLREGARTVDLWRQPVELVHGNFLPHGAESLADDSTLPSLGHDERSAYDQIGLELDDFALIYAYPWPGEDDFHEAVFDRFAAPGAMLLLFCGPNDLRLWRKQP